MRILLLHSRPLDFSVAVGGVPEFLHALTFEFRQMGLDVMIYAAHKSFDQISHTSTIHDSVKIFSGPIVEPAFWISRKNLSLAADFCRAEKVDVLHSQGTYTPGFMCREIHRLTNIPYVLTSHSDISPVNSDRLQRYSVRSRYRRILRDAAWVTHLTPVMEHASHQMLDTRCKSTLIHNGIAVEQWQPYQNLQEKNYVLGIGRLERGKGFHVLVDMYAELCRRNVKTTLVIAGTGDAHDDLLRQCHSLGLPVITEYHGVQSLPEQGVVFTGYVRGTAKQELIAHSQCVLFATQPDLWEEAFGLVQLEAMAAAKPLAASDIAAVRHLASFGMRAEIVPPRDVSAWAGAVENLLADARKRQRMGHENAAAVRQFNWRGIAGQYQKVYERCLDM